MKRQIVWIDDDTHIIYPLVKPLERAGYEIVTMRDLVEAQSRLDEVFGATVVILDLIFPDKTQDKYPGLMFMRFLRSQETFQVPVIVLSVVSNHKVVDELKELGVTSVLRKPVLPSELADTVASVLGLPSPDQEASVS